MDTKHTPGPWKFSFNEMGGYDCITDAYEVTTEKGEHIALIDLRQYEQVISGNMLDMPSTNEALANARLIASAPELLKALEELLPVAKSAFGVFGDMAVSIILAEAAIAKAKGKT